jgi:hypothetical protein
MKGAACIGKSYAHAESQTRQDYDGWIHALDDVLTRIAVECELDNPRFNTSKFRARIGHYATD